ncbi:MAG: hypothetical protein PVI40_04080 [Chlamydiota bacterium]|jgi:hypothetical protein
MKKMIILMLVTISVETSFAASWEIPEHDLKIVNVCDLTSQELNKAMSGGLPNLVIEFSENTMLPINFFLKGNLVNLVEKKESFEHVQVKQTFYARFVEEELILSSDLSEWKPFLEFITGNISVAVSIQEGNPSIVFGAETNRRIYE